MRDVCWWCGGKLVWQADHFLESADHPSISWHGVADLSLTQLQCYDCGAWVEYTMSEEIRAQRGNEDE